MKIDMLMNINLNEEKKLKTKSYLIMCGSFIRTDMTYR